MVASSYEECLRRLLVHEGGYSNHPADPGGPTNFGITIGDYRRYVKADATAADVRAMRVDVAKRIYREKYWAALRCDDLPAGVDATVFDYGVNSGIGRAGKVLRRVLGLPDDAGGVTDDVLRELAKRDPSAVIAAINDERLRFLRSLRTWPVFGAGWSRRVAEVRAFSLALATSAPSTPAPQQAPAASHASAKSVVAVPKSVRTAVVVAAGAAAGAAGSAHVVGMPPLVSLAVFAAVVAAAAGILALPARGRRARQEAPTPDLVPVPAIKTEERS
jgi:lysozyme family protein